MLPLGAAVYLFDTKRLDYWHLFHLVRGVLFGASGVLNAPWTEAIRLLRFVPTVAAGPRGPCW